MTYFLAQYNGYSDWSLEEFNSLDKIKQEIKSGRIGSYEFKVLKEIDFKFIEAGGE